MKKILFVKNEYCEYSDEDILSVYKCINKIKNKERLVYYYCKSNYLIDVLCSGDKGGVKKLVSFDNVDDANEVINFAIKNNIEHIVLLKLSHNFVLLYNMVAYISGVNIYAI